MDTLSTTIGKVDHPDRIRGESKTVGLTEYFGRASRTVKQSQLSPEDLSQLESQIEARLEVRLEAKIRAEMVSLFNERMESFTRATMQASLNHEGQSNKVRS